MQYRKWKLFQSNLHICIFQDKSDESCIVEGSSYGGTAFTDKSVGELS